MVNNVLVPMGQIIDTQNRNVEVVTATTGQTVFLLNAAQYVTGMNTLDVYVNGLHQKPSAFVETSNSSVTFNVGLAAGDIVEFVSNVVVNNGNIATAASTSASASANASALSASNSEQSNIQSTSSASASATSATQSASSATASASSAAAALVSEQNAASTKFSGEIGTLMNPLVHIPFKRQDDEQALSGVQTFARASIGTYIDALDGLVKTAAIDAPRFEKMADGETGILLEGASTNYFPQSQLATTFNSGGYTRADNTIIAPDGTLTGGTITAAALNAYNGVLVTPPAPIAGKTYTASMWIKATNPVDVGQLCTFFLYEDLANVSSVQNTITAGWQRITITHTVDPLAIVTTLLFRIDARTSGTALIGESLDVWGMQLEALPSATSYIPTFGVPVTRAEDYSTIGISGNRKKAHDTVSYVIDYDTTVKNTDGVICNVVNLGVNEDHMLIRHSSGFSTSAQIYMGSSDFRYFNTPPSNTVNRVVVVMNGALGEVFVNGVSNGTRTFAATVGVSTLIRFGGWNITELNGHIRNFRIYDRALTASEVAAA